MQVLEQQITVQYLDHLGSDVTVVDAARASFGKESAGYTNGELPQADVSLIRFLASGYRTEEWVKLLRSVVDCTSLDDAEQIIVAARKRPVHWTPFAHPKLRLRMTVPLFVARQVVKHQVGGDWSEESRRYIDDAPTFWFPDKWHSRPEDVKQGSGEALSDRHQAVCNQLSLHSTQTALQTYTRLMEVGAAPEEARSVLPLNHMTTVVWTGSLLFWARVCNLRLDGHAQLATQELAEKIRDVVQPHFPISWGQLVG